MTLYTRSEQRHLDALRRRLDYLRGTPAFVTGEVFTTTEARALGWVLDILEGAALPMETRLHRLKSESQRFATRIAEFERDFYEAEDELPVID